VTAEAVTSNTGEATAKVVASKAITSATLTMTAAAGKCAGAKHEISENKDDCKADYGFSQHQQLHSDACTPLDSRTDVDQLVAGGFQFMLKSMNARL
jgi:hypothetical protein